MKFLFLASRFISVFNPVTSKNTKLERDRVIWTGTPRHHPVTWGSAEQAQGAIRAPQLPWHLSWDLTNTPACTVAYLHPRLQPRSEGVYIQFSQAQGGCVWPSLHLSLTVLCLGPCSLLTQQQLLLLPGSCCTLKALGYSFETYLWMTLVLAYRTVCINGSDTPELGEKSRFSCQFWFPLSKSSQDCPFQPQRPKPIKDSGHQS